MRTLLGLPARLVVSLAIVAAVASLAVIGTLAYFSGTSDDSVSIQTATISVGKVSGFPLSFTNMLPGETQAQDIQIQNTGSAKADLYVQLISTPGGTNFCTPNDVLDVSIDDLADGDQGGDIYNASICPLFPGWGGSIIAKVADDVAAAGVKTFRVRLTLDTTAGNAYQDASNTDTAHLIAVQYNGPAPLPDLQGGATQNAWPADISGIDDDPNYP